MGRDDVVRVPSDGQGESGEGAALFKDRHVGMGRAAGVGRERRGRRRQSRVRGESQLRHALVARQHNVRVDRSVRIS